MRIHTIGATIDLRCPYFNQLPVQPGNGRLVYKLVKCVHCIICSGLNNIKIDSLFHIIFFDYSKVDGNSAGKNREYAEKHVKYNLLCYQNGKMERRFFMMIMIFADK